MEFFNSLFLIFLFLNIVIHFASLEKQIKIIKQKADQNNYILREIAKKVGVEEKLEPNDQIILSLLVEGKKIAAIKKAREVYPHLGLKEAKKYVEDLERKQI